ncbi:uncharacterized protein G2W53_039774 [Senna tora]|uniref:Uncharacterized protein n=1 Tax=Senna tora TaxID=362788 RepID=A0A834SR39_9FABA|nr:uncharacterized protein G2W53_039774 [Senna tora]
MGLEVAWVMGVTVCWGMGEGLGVRLWGGIVREGSVLVEKGTGSRLEGGVVQFWGRLEGGWLWWCGIRGVGFGEGMKEVVWFWGLRMGHGVVRVGGLRFWWLGGRVGWVNGWKKDGGLEGGWVNVVWWGCYRGVAMEVEVVGKKKKRLERERGRFWGERRKRGC